MRPCVLDASVVAAAFFEEEHANAARALLLSERELHAPDLIYPELANVIWKRRRRGEIDEQEAARLLSDVLSLPLRIASSERLVGPALQIALLTERTVYDCMYLALAVQTKGVMVSGDRRLVSALAGSPLEKHIAWVGEHR